MNSPHLGHHPPPPPKYGRVAAGEGKKGGGRRGLLNKMKEMPGGATSCIENWRKCVLDSEVTHMSLWFFVHSFVRTTTVVLVSPNGGKRLFSGERGRGRRITTGTAMLQCCR